ncbi:MAG: hypothetical protein LBH40_01105 [Alphaproteobacteria bacterium]|nr:hypothetical protein [Alphaproteobacteria bacterium]
MSQKIVISDITSIITTDGLTEEFQQCMLKEAPALANLVSNKEKLITLADISVEDLERIHQAVQTCKLK